VFGRNDRHDSFGSNGFLDDFRVRRRNRGDGNLDLAVEHHRFKRIGVTGAQCRMNLRMEFNEGL
jgi:hypothetical protein